MRLKHLEKPTWDSMSKPEGQICLLISSDDKIFFYIFR